MKQFILSILLISGIAQASPDDWIGSFGVSGGTWVRGPLNMEEGRTLVRTPTPQTKYPWSGYPQISMEFGGSTYGGPGRSSARAARDVPSVVVAARSSTPVVSAGAGGGGSVSASGSIRAPLRAYPPIAIGHEADYDRFLSGILTYKPNKDNDIGLVYLRIRDLENPLDGTFDLSKCGDIGKYISIHTGYKKANIPKNKNKAEIWLTPKFLVEANLRGDAGWMSGVMSEWKAPYGIVWTWGDNDVESNNFDYLVRGKVLLNKDKSLYEKWICRESNIDFSWKKSEPLQRSYHRIANLFLNFD